MANGVKLVSDGTSNHLVLADLTPKKVDGSRVERVLELCGMHANKNTVPGDKSALTPHGLRMGTPALTSRGLNETDMKAVAGFIVRGIDLAAKIRQETGPKKKDFEAAVTAPNAEIDALRNDVEAFAVGFPVPGLDQTTMKYPA
mmetsp:Transcript_57170/g.134561  ORF Transcript_57170/g.134561 Transcript_57170/m.134561 type:complete len:144 (+) Transcript_57170:52-483(+)